MKIKHDLRRRRAARVRVRIFGTGAAPRLTVKRSAKHIYAQLIDDSIGRTLVAASDAGLPVGEKPMAKAKEVGRLLSERAQEKGIKKAVFDRGPYRYHGRVAALAESARLTGLLF